MNGRVEARGVTPTALPLKTNRKFIQKKETSPIQHSLHQEIRVPGIKRLEKQVLASRYPKATTHP
jgi:hypothetical protein